MQTNSERIKPHDLVGFINGRIKGMSAIFTLLTLQMLIKVWKIQIGRL